ncbi:MAG: TetR/AcrR family transcriptional regulator [Acidimicrobiia bacterium]|nr:TetR/AcrR family transcriptional regulator [Acidimicrobiia bacterium]
MTTSTRLPRAERRQAILRGAARAFAERGYAGTSMEAIAEAAGITKLIVYRHFESKADLYRAVVTDVVESIAAADRAGLASGAGPRSHALALLQAAREDPDGFRLVFRHAVREPEFADLVDTTRRRGVEFVRGLLEPVLPDRRMLGWAAETALSFSVQATLNWLDSGDADRDDEFVGLATASLEALVRTWAVRDGEGA